jgi:hypothetical protein
LIIIIIIRMTLHIIIDWLSQREGDPKHLQWTHPTVVFLVHYAVTTWITFVMHDWMLDYYYSYYYFHERSVHPDRYDDVGGDSNTCSTTCNQHDDHPYWHHTTSSIHLRERRIWIAVWLISYTCAIFLRRLLVEPADNTVVYQYCWLCNVTLFQGALAFITNRPIIAMAYCVTIGIDQLLWYVDLTGYVLTSGQTFVIGVTKYLFWPGNKDARWTCTHHLWTIPLILYGTGVRIHVLALPLSLIYMTTNVLLSRFMSPATIQSSYLNINLSHAVWKDISFRFLQINSDDPPVLLYLFRLLWRWQGFNTIIFGILYLATRHLHHSHHTIMAPMS